MFPIQFIHATQKFGPFKGSTNKGTAFTYYLFTWAQQIAVANGMIGVMQCSGWIGWYGNDSFAVLASGSQLYGNSIPAVMDKVIESTLLNDVHTTMNSSDSADTSQDAYDRAMGIVGGRPQKSTTPPTPAVTKPLTPEQKKAFDHANGVV